MSSNHFISLVYLFLALLVSGVWDTVHQVRIHKLELKVTELESVYVQDNRPSQPVNNSKKK